MNRKQIAEEFSKSLDYPEIEKIILFGSVDRGEVTEDSDIDLLIISSKKQETKDKLMEKVGDAILKLGVYISAKVISKKEYENLENTHFISNIKKEDVVLDEKQILTENAYKKLEAAKTLSKNEFYGDAVSRAYYAMFFATNALLSQKDIYPRTHRGLISQFGLEFMKKGEFKKELFDLLTRAPEDQEEADYGLLSELGKKEAEVIIDGAEMFLKECKSLISL